MLKFAALEKKAKDKEEKETERKMSNRATETSAQPAQVDKSPMTLQILANWRCRCLAILSRMID